MSFTNQGKIPFLGVLDKHGHKVFGTLPTPKKQQETPLYVYSLLDAIEELFESRAFALERLNYETDLDPADPTFREEAARFWRDLRPKLLMFGPLPKRIREELDLLCEVRP